MWKTINQQISQAIHYDFKHTHKRQLQNTSTDKLFHLSDGKHNYLVKIAQKHELERFEAQAQGLIWFLGILIHLHPLDTSNELNHVMKSLPVKYYVDKGLNLFKM